MRKEEEGREDEEEEGDRGSRRVGGEGRRKQQTTPIRRVGNNQTDSISKMTATRESTKSERLDIKHDS